MIGASEPAAEELRALHEKAQSWITRSLPAILAAADDIAASTARGDYTSARASAGALREATARLESGLSAHIGMAQGRAPRDIALAWYRSEMQLQGAQPEAPALFGFTVRHLSLMAVLTLVLAGLLLIQLLRARRAEVPDPDDAVGHAHAAVVPLGPRLALVGSYHVSQQNTFTGRLTAAMFDDVLATAARAGR